VVYLSGVIPYERPVVANILNDKELGYKTSTRNSTTEGPKKGDGICYNTIGTRSDEWMGRYNFVHALKMILNEEDKP